MFRQFRTVTVRPFPGNTIKFGDVEVPVFAYDLTCHDQLALFAASVLIDVARIRKQREENHA